MAILDKGGSLKTAIEYESISLDSGTYRLAKLPYFLKVSKIGDVLYCTEGRRESETYSPRHNMLYKAGFPETIIGEAHRHLATSELELVGQFSWNSVLETARKWN